MNSLPLSMAEEKALTTLAKSLGSLSRSGATYGKPSWRRLISDLAAGEFIIRRRYPDRGTGAVVATAAAKAPSKEEPAGETLPQSAPPLWWPLDEDGNLMPDCMYEELRPDLILEARALGCHDTGRSFIALDEWLDDEIKGAPSTPAPETPSPSFPQGWIDSILRQRPAWWPERGCSRGELVELLGIHEGEGPADTDRWIAEQGEWVMDGDRYQRAAGWTAEQA